MKKIILCLLMAGSLQAVAQSDDKICGDISKYKQTYDWRDLPGCISDYREEGEESMNTKGLLAYAKMQFKNFYDRWDAHKQLDTEDPIQTYVTACNFFKNVTAKEKWDTDPVLKAAEPLFEEQAKKVAEAYDVYYFKWKEIVMDLNQAYFYAEAMMPEIEKEFENAKGKKMYGEIATGERALLASKVKDTKELLAKAVKVDIPDGLVLLGSGEEIPSATIAQVRDSYLKKWSAYSEQVDKKALELYEAELAPYLKLMSGDKAKTFRNWYGLIIFGPGGKELKTPQEIANSRVWYSSGTPPCTICPRWAVSGIHFNGNSIARTSREEGYGTFAPSSAFK